MNAKYPENGCYDTSHENNDKSTIKHNDPQTSMICN